VYYPSKVLHEQNMEPAPEFKLYRQFTLHHRIAVLVAIVVTPVISAGCFVH